MLAQYMCAQVLDALRALGVQQIQAIEIEVEESFGQAAIYREEVHDAHAQSDA
jgi:hypothetical protein